MKSTLSKLIIFAAGATIGSLVTWKVVKDKYEQIANEAIESMEEYFSNKYNADKSEEEVETSEDEEEPELEDFEIQKYNDVLAQMRYAIDPKATRYTGPSIDPDDEEEEDEDEEENDPERPYVISADEFGDYPEYNLVQLTYYKDGFLTTILDEIVDDADDIIGLESLHHFDDDVVFVRNDKRKTDFEITLDMRNYRDIIDSKPRHVEVE